MYWKQKPNNHKHLDVRRTSLSYRNLWQPVSDYLSSDMQQWNKAEGNNNTDYKDNKWYHFIIDSHSFGVKFLTVKTITQLPNWLACSIATSIYPQKWNAEKLSHNGIALTVPFCVKELTDISLGWKRTISFQWQHDHEWVNIEQEQKEHHSYLLLE